MSLSRAAILGEAAAKLRSLGYPEAADLVRETPSRTEVRRECHRQLLAICRRHFPPRPGETWWKPGEALHAAIDSYLPEWLAKHGNKSKNPHEPGSLYYDLWLLLWSSPIETIPSTVPGMLALLRREAARGGSS